MNFLYISFIYNDIFIIQIKMNPIVFYCYNFYHEIVISSICLYSIYLPFVDQTVALIKVKLSFKYHNLKNPDESFGKKYCVL